LSIQKSIPCSIFYLVLAKKMLSVTWPAVADASLPLSWLHKSCGGKSKGLWNLFGRMPLAEHAMLFPSGRVPFALGFCYERAGCWLLGIDDIFLYAISIFFPCLGRWTDERKDAECPHMFGLPSAARPHSVFGAAATMMHC
jgi:hypothetical protein